MIIRIFIIFVTFVNISFAALNKADVDKIIVDEYKKTKSREKLEIPEYKGPVITFESISQMKNIFDFAHEMPFKKEKETQESDNSSKALHSTIPDELGLLMQQPKNEYQQYPIGAFKFNGVVLQDNEEWAVITLPDKPSPVYLREGEAIGDNYGVIKKITKDGMLIVEWKKDPTTDGWEKVETLVE